MKINPYNVSFGSKYQIKGEDIYLNNPAHLMALGFGIGASKNSSESYYRYFYTAFSAVFVCFLGMVRKAGK